ncbi:MAG: metallophosphoesterase family protein [Nitrososphaeraceae archaeon]
MVTGLEELNEDLPLADFCNVLDASTRVLKNQDESGQISGGKVVGSLVKLEIPQRLVVIGDIHGDYGALNTILSKINYEHYLSDDNNKLIFLGDYIDRGRRSPEVLYTVCFLKARFPQSVILIRGNHEAPDEFPFPSHDFPFRIMDLFGRERSMALYYQKILPFFHALYLSVVIKDCFVIVHGGVPTQLPHDGPEAVETLSRAQANYLTSETMEEILWNDPRDSIVDNGNFERSRRGIGKHFGRSVSQAWLRKLDVKVNLRGHEPCGGYKIDHQGLVFTIFTCKESYPKSKAAYLDIDSDQMIHLQNGYDLRQHIKYL